MTGYIRQDTSNNIANGNIINAADFDNEYDAIAAAFHAVTGHDHDGTSAEGAPITKVGPAQDVVVSASAVTPKTDDTVDLGSTTNEFKDLYIDGTANIDALVADTADINAGTIDNASVGATTPSTGAFTTLTSSSTTTLNGTSIPASKTLLVSTDIGASVVGPSATQTLTNKTLSTGSSWQGDVVSAQYGGTGMATLASNNVILGNGTSPVNFVAPGTSGNVLTSNGTTWTSAAPSGSLLGDTDSATPYETSLGYNAGANNTATANTYIGYTAGSANVTGSNNTALGFEALTNSTAGDANVAIGASALSISTGSVENVAIGASAGRAITTGQRNTIIGASAATLLSTGTNNTVIGYSAAPSTTSVSNQITLGNSSIATLRCQVTTITGLSDARDKTNITDLDAGLSFVNALKPVRFVWNMRDGGKVGIADTGFIAQDLKAVQEETAMPIPGLVYDANPEMLEASYGRLIPVLVKAIQELSAEVDRLKQAAA